MSRRTIVVVEDDGAIAGAIAFGGLPDSAIALGATLVVQPIKAGRRRCWLRLCG